jgi:hypothetical protein
LPVTGSWGSEARRQSAIRFTELTTDSALTPAMIEFKCLMSHASMEKRISVKSAARLSMVSLSILPSFSLMILAISASVPGS